MAAIESIRVYVVYQWTGGTGRTWEEWQTFINAAKTGALAQWIIQHVRASQNQININRLGVPDTDPAKWFAILGDFEIDREYKAEGLAMLDSLATTYNVSGNAIAGCLQWEARQAVLDLGYPQGVADNISVLAVAVGQREQAIIDTHAWIEDASRIDDWIFNSA